MTPSTHQPRPTNITVWWLDDSDDPRNRPDDNTADAATATAHLRSVAATTERATASTSAPEATPASAPVTPAIPQSAATGQRGFLARLSRQLVLTYTTATDVVVDLHRHTGLQQAISDTGRTYLHLADPTRIADLDRRSAPTSLVLFTLPDDAGYAQLSDLLLASRLIMTGDQATLAILQTTGHDPDQPSAGSRLRAAAMHIGLRPAGTILALHSPGHGNRYLYSVTADQAHDLLTAHPTPAAAPVWVRLYTTTPGHHYG